jgi:MerR family transcriptional regulator, light-induced transcriptional regulator
MNQFTIKDLEHLSGIKAHTIRIWEQRYSFLKPERTLTNIRYYNNDHLKMILNIALLNKYGYKISHIDKMTEDDIREKILSLTHSEAQDESRVNQLIQSMVDVDMHHFESLLNQYIREHNVQKTVMQIIFPFLERIGMLWVTNHIHPAQEHLVSNIIRQKLIIAIDQLPLNDASRPAILMFLPEGEFHEIGLLFMQYILKSGGHNILYVGANIPLKEVAAIVNSTKVSCLYSHLTSASEKFPLERFLNQLCLKIPKTPAIVSGSLLTRYGKTPPPDIHFAHSLPEAIKTVNNILFKN